MSIDLARSKNIVVVGECWEWQKSKAGIGYGVLSFYSRNYAELVYGESTISISKGATK